ncbi:unnamed protein product [Ilex paraguariensis]|uniref:Glycosyltransferase N-terminal domain-containing protein n=1 Tax=Ilex paraguariensis TaxID=185542 RepID=A0ABC8SL56_9AQUA
MASRTHVLVVPFPVQGHINPMLQFSKRLASKGLRVTLVTITISKSMESQTSSVKIESISDGFDEGEKLEGHAGFIKRMMLLLWQCLPELIEKQKSTGYPVKVLVYDSIMPWALEIAHKLGVCGASFLTQSCAVCVIYYHMHQGTLKTSLKGFTVSLPSMPRLRNEDLPFFIYDNVSYPDALRFLVDQFSNFQDADWLLINTYDKLEDELQVLAHYAVGCFMTHCGWNSTLEALSLGVPLLAMPQWTDQPTKAKFIVDVWQVGIRLKVDEKGTVIREEIENFINEVMEGERGKELKRNVVKLKELAKEAVDEGGSSTINIEEFVSEVLST